MRIGGWKTRSVFERYAIVSRSDIADAMLKLELSEKALEESAKNENWSRIGHAAQRTPAPCAPALTAPMQQVLEASVN